MLAAFLVSEFARGGKGKFHLSLVYLDNKYHEAGYCQSLGFSATSGRGGLLTAT